MNAFLLVILASTPCDLPEAKAVHYRNELARGTLVPASVSLNGKVVRDSDTVPHMDELLGPSESGPVNERDANAQCAYLRGLLAAHDNTMVFYTLVAIANKSLSGRFGTSDWHLASGLLRAHWSARGDTKAVYLLELRPNPVAVESVTGKTNARLKRTGMAFDVSTNRVELTE